MHPELIPRVEPVMLDLHAATWTAPDRYEVRDDAGRFEMWERDVAAQIGLGRRRRPRARLGHRRHRRAQRPRSPPGCGLGWPTSPASPSATEASSSAPSPPSRSTASIPRTCRRRLRGEGVQRVGHAPLDSAQLDLSNRGLDSVVRASVHYVTTDDELDRFAAVHESADADARPVSAGVDRPVSCGGGPAS